MSSAARQEGSGLRSGAFLAVTSAVSIVANYVFLLAAGRVLGSSQYGALAALLGLLAVVLTPAGALQMAMSREISRRIASGDSEGAYSFANRVLRLAAIGTIPLMAAALALAAPLAHLLNIDSVGIVVLAEATFVTALVSPIAMGVLQGGQRFVALGLMYIVPFLWRLVFFAIAAAAGYRLGGAVFATVASTIAGTLLAFVLIRTSLRNEQRGARPDLGPFLRYLGPVAVGLIGIALLTHIDLLIVKARFSAADAGAYAGASAFARVGFFLPATILTVLFPRTAARHARGEETEDILGRSLLATTLFCGALALFYAGAGVGLISMTFGPDFAEGGRILAPFTVAIGLFSLANILAGYHLSRGETRYAWIVAFGVAVQMILLALVPSSLRGVVWTNVLLGVGLLVAHEVLVGSSLPALRSAARRARAATVSFRAKLPESAAVLLACTAFTCLLFWRLVSHFGSTIIGSLGSDSTGGVWWLWQLNHESGYHLLGITHHTLSGAPFGWDQGNGLNLQWFLPYYPAYLATKVFGEIVAFNLVVISGYVFSGATMYLLVRYLRCSRAVAAWAAFVYIIFPWHVARAEHASLVHLEVLVLLVLALVAAVQKPSWLRFGFVGVATLLCWLTSGYFGAEALVTTVAFTVGAALTADSRTRKRVLIGATAFALAATSLIALGSFTSGVNRGAGLHRTVEDLSIGGLRGYELVVPADGNVVLGGQLSSFHASHLHGTNVTEASNYLGLLTIALALGWLVHAWRRRKQLQQWLRAATAGLLSAFAVGLLFALPSPVSLFGHEIWMPARVLWEVIPAFRAPSRWTPLLMTALVPLAALELQGLRTRFSHNGARSRLVPAAIVVAAVLFSYLELAISPARQHFRTVPVPPEYTAVAKTRPGVLAEYPLGSSDVYRFWQRRHGHALLNGAPAATTADQARLVLLDPSQPGRAQALALLGVTSILIHQHAVVDAEVLPGAPTVQEGYGLVGRFPDGTSVWQVDAPPAAAFVTLPGGFGVPSRQQDGLVMYPLVSTAGVGVMEIRAKVGGVVLLVFDAELPQGKSGRLRLAGTDREQVFDVRGRTRIALRVAVPRGLSRALVKIDPAPTSAADAVLISAPAADRSNGPADVRADPVSADPGF